MTILTLVSQLAEASGPDLIATFKAFGGKFKEGSAERFASREAGQRRVEMLMLAAKDADGHLGVVPNSAPASLTQEQLATKAAKKGVPAPVIEDKGEGVEKGVPAFADGTLAKELQGKADALKPVEPRARKTPAPASNKEPRAAKEDFYAFRITAGGTSKFQYGSRRHGMYLYIAKAPNQARTLENIEKYFDMGCRGEMGKLLKFFHITSLTETQYKALPAKMTSPVDI